MRSISVLIALVVTSCRPGSYVMSTTTTSTTSTTWSSEPPPATRPNPCGARTRLECARYAEQLRERKDPAAVRVLEGACALGDGKSCANAGFDLQATDPERAIRVTEYGCTKLSFPLACTNFAVMLEKGTGTVPDPDRALKIYLEYCSKHDARACRYAGNWYTDKAFGPVQPALAASAYLDACKLGDAVGCELAPAWAREGGKPLLPGDEEALLRASCTRDNPQGCASWGTFLESLGRPALSAFKDGCAMKSAESCRKLYWAERRADDAQAAFAAAKRACELDAAACWEYGLAQYERREAAAAAKTWEAVCAQDVAAGCRSLGIAYLRGEGRPLDGEQALAQFDRGCQLGDGRTCASAAAELVLGQVVKPDKVRARTYVERACELGSCNLLATFEHEGALGKKDFARARALFVRGCENAEARSCVGAAYMVAKGEGGEADPYRAASLASRGCDAHDALSCNLFAYALVEGKGVAKDPPRAMSLWEEACKTLPEACDSIGEANEKGLGGAPKSLPTAYERYMQACNRGVQVSCKNAQRVAKALRRPPPVLPKPAVVPASTPPAGKSAGLPVPDLRGLLQSF